jgi:UDP-glucose-4-epimerase GalE
MTDRDQATSTLVTGGAGFIGSHVAHALVAAGRRVVVFDNLTAGRAAAVPDGCPLVAGDIRDGGLLAETIRTHAVDEVVHLAAEKSVAASMQHPGPAFAVNVGGTVGLLEAMAETGVRRLVFSSTCAVYGNPARLPIDEAAPLAPENPYGESKLQAERAIAWFERIEGIRSIVLRYFNAAGVTPPAADEDWTKAENLIPVVLRAAAEDGIVRIFGTDYPTPDGTAVRDFVHVQDLAEAHLAALERLRSGGDGATLNLGRGTGSSVREVIEAAERITGRHIRVEEAPRRPGDPAAVWADPRRAAETLGWRATRDLESMLASAWAARRMGRAPGSATGGTLG